MITDVVKHLIRKGEKQEDAEIIFKTILAESTMYEYKRLALGEYITFSKLKSDAEQSRQYYGSLAEEISIKSEKIALLISHGQTVGNYRELILRELLKKYVPKKISIATGFIEDISKQIDILIYDSQNHSPVFIEGELVVVLREAVKVIIEVKSNLDTKTLKETLQDTYDMTREGIFKPTIPIFKGLFAFDSKYEDTSSIANVIKEFYTVPFWVEKMQCDVTNDVQYLFNEITCVAVPNKHCLFSQYMLANNNDTDNLIPKLLSISDEKKTDIHTAMFIATLFDYLDVDLNANRSFLSAFSRLYRSRRIGIKVEAKLTSDNWVPSIRSKNEHDGTQLSIKKRFDRISGWFSGSVSTSELLIDA